MRKDTGIRRPELDMVGYEAREQRDGQVWYFPVYVPPKRPSGMVLDVIRAFHPRYQAVDGFVSLLRDIINYPGNIRWSQDPTIWNKKHPNRYTLDIETKKLEYNELIVSACLDNPFLYNAWSSWNKRGEYRFDLKEIISKKDGQ